MLYAVRSNHDDPTGTTTHEMLYGYGPTVFKDREQAEELAGKLTEEAPELKWNGDTPEYYVEEVKLSELSAAELA